MASGKMTLKIDLCTPFGIRAVRSARKAIYAMASEWGFNERELREIELSFSEALQNAMEHGASGSGTVATRTTVSSKEIQIVIEDPGAGPGNCESLKALFQKAEKEIPDIDEERGRGLYLIRSLMDDSGVECMEGGGVRITMVKRRR
jgi:anti-sigma regulatory factor (Ser/Thr protein kinase)